MPRFQFQAGRPDASLKLAALRADAAADRFRLSIIRLKLKLLQLAYDPDQPRVLAGSSDGGQWTDGGGGSDLSDEAQRKLQSKRDALVNWAKEQVGSKRWMMITPNDHTGGHLGGYLFGVGTPKCNIFVGDGFAAAGIRVQDPNNSRFYPNTRQWADRSTHIAGFRLLRPREAPKAGDVVSNGKHVGIYIPGPKGERHTISAADVRTGNRVVHNAWGFRGDEGAIVIRRYTGGP